MFVYTAKFSKKYLVLAVLALVVVVAAILLIAGNFGQSDNASPTIAETARTNEDRVSFLTSLGWEIEPEPVETVSVRIPEKLSEVYAGYNTLQLSQGRDLSDYAGKLATRYTYKVTNYPTGDNSVVADIIVYRGKVIAGDIQSVALNGFMHGLEYPKG